MDKDYHIAITNQSLGDEFSPSALQVILDANLGQDNLIGLIFHPEYHFDNNCFETGSNYMSQQRALVETSLDKGKALPAWKAFGRLTHSAQDYYAHSNYVRLWLATQAAGDLNGGETSGAPAPDLIDPLDARVLNSPNLISGRIYYPWEVLSFTPIPGLETLMRRLLPPDSHTCLNLDSPAGGPLFAYAFAAARKRTGYEFERLAERLSGGKLELFRDLVSH